MEIFKIAILKYNLKALINKAIEILPDNENHKMKQYALSLIFNKKYDTVEDFIIKEFESYFENLIKINSNLRKKLDKLKNNIYLKENNEDTDFNNKIKFDDTLKKDSDYNNNIIMEKMKSSKFNNNDLYNEFLNFKCNKKNCIENKLKQLLMISKSEKDKC